MHIQRYPHIYIAWILLRLNARSINAKFSYTALPYIPFYPLLLVIDLQPKEIFVYLYLVLARILGLIPFSYLNSGNLKLYNFIYLLINCVYKTHIISIPIFRKKCDFCLKIKKSLNNNNSLIEQPVLIDNKIRESYVLDMCSSSQYFIITIHNYQLKSSVLGFCPLSQNISKTIRTRKLKFCKQGCMST